MARMLTSTLLAPGAFGYRSVQFVARVPPAGLGSDHGEFRNQIADFDWMGASTGTVEIQIRSILEHAWAEIEHDLVYKSMDDVPNNVLRQFALTAALLESADTHLDNIRSELTVGEARRDEVEEEDAKRHFVQRLIETDTTSRALDAQIAAALDLPLGRPEKYLPEVSRAIGIAHWKSMADVRNALLTGQTLARRMAIASTSVTNPPFFADFPPLDKVPRWRFPALESIGSDSQLVRSSCAARRTTSLPCRL